MIEMGGINVYGTMGILNVGQGDTKLSFDRNNPADRIRAARIVTDMLRRGYALLVEAGEGEDKHFVRATAFDENTCEYIIADFDPLVAARADAEETEDEPEPAAETSAPARGLEDGPPLRKRRGRAPKVKVDASKTRAVAVARSAGG